MFPATLHCFQAFVDYAACLVQALRSGVHELAQLPVELVRVLGENRQLLPLNCLSIACHCVDVELVPRSSGPPDRGCHDDAYRTGPGQAYRLQSFSRRDLLHLSCSHEGCAETANSMGSCLGKSNQTWQVCAGVASMQVGKQVLGVECRFLDASTLAGEQHSQLTDLLQPPSFRRSTELVQDSRDSCPRMGFPDSRMGPTSLHQRWLHCTAASAKVYCHSPAVPLARCMLASALLACFLALPGLMDDGGQHTTSHPSVFAAHFTHWHPAGGRRRLILAFPTANMHICRVGGREGVR